MLDRSPHPQPIPLLHLSTVSHSGPEYAPRTCTCGVELLAPCWLCTRPSALYCSPCHHLAPLAFGRIQCVELTDCNGSVVAVCIWHSCTRDAIRHHLIYNKSSCLGRRSHNDEDITGVSLDEDHGAVSLADIDLCVCVCMCVCVCVMNFCILSFIRIICCSGMCSLSPPYPCCCKSPGMSHMEQAADLQA